MRFTGFSSVQYTYHHMTATTPAPTTTSVPQAASVTSCKLILDLNPHESLYLVIRGKTAFVVCYSLHRALALGGGDQNKKAEFDVLRRFCFSYMTTQSITHISNCVVEALSEGRLEGKVHLVNRYVSNEPGINNAHFDASIVNTGWLMPDRYCSGSWDSLDEVAMQALREKATTQVKYVAS